MHTAKITLQREQELLAEIKAAAVLTDAEFSNIKTEAQITVRREWRLASIHKQHSKHFYADGWTPLEVDRAASWGVRSVSQREATRLLGRSADYPAPSGGLWFPFGGDSGYGSLRLDSPGTEDPKYLAPSKRKANPTAWTPPGEDLDSLSAVTEGWKDAFIATVRGGVAVGALAGVSHYRVLPKGCRKTLLFDSDGWGNPSVMRQLLLGGVYLQGKIQLFPEMPDYPKGGATEFFRAGHTADDFKALLLNAYTPEQLFREWLDRMELSGTMPKMPGSCRSPQDTLYRWLFHLAHEIAPASPTLQNRVFEFIKAFSKKIKAPLTKPLIQKFADQALAPVRKQNWRNEREAKRERLSHNWVIEPSGCLGPAVGRNKYGAIEIAKPGKLAALMQKQWGDRLVWRLEVGQFYLYGRTTPGRWDFVSEREISALVQHELDIAGAQGEYSSGLVQGVAELLSQRLAVKTWEEDRRYLPFKNGVLDMRTMHLKEHSPKFNFAWQLPYDFDPNAKPGPILEWLNGLFDADVVRLLQAVFKAVLTGRTDFQRYLELEGKPRAGKGVMSRLIQALVGSANTVATSFDRLANNRFETSRFLNKRLLVLPDASYNDRAIEKLKDLTGGDLQPFERKGENADYLDGFHLRAWLVVATNRPTPASDGSTALFERRILIHFDQTVEEKERRCLLEFEQDGSPYGAFAPYLSGLMNWVLSIPDEMMEACIRTPRLCAPTLARFDAAAMLDDPLIAWMNERLELLTEDDFARAESLTGDERLMHLSVPVGNYDQDPSAYLYPNYREFLNSLNGPSAKPLGLLAWRKRVSDFLETQLRIPGLQFAKLGKGQARLVGVRLVTQSDDGLIETHLRGGSRGFCGGSAGDSAGDESIDSGGLRGMRGSESTLAYTEKNSSPEGDPKRGSEKDGVIGNKANSPDTPAEPRQQGIEPPAIPPHHPPRTPANPREGYVLVDPGRMQKGQPVFWWDESRSNLWSATICECSDFFAQEKGLITIRYQLNTVRVPASTLYRRSE